MRKMLIPAAFLLGATVAMLHISCAKDDLMATLSEQADPDNTPVLQATDTGGLWAVKKEICLIPGPEDDE